MVLQEPENEGQRKHGEGPRAEGQEEKDLSFQPILANVCSYEELCSGYSLRNSG